MLKFIKILFLLALVAALIVVCGYMYFKDSILEKAGIRLSSEITKISKRPVKIGSIGYIPFQTLSFKDISIFESDSKEERSAVVGSLKVTFDTISMLMNKQLSVTVDMETLRSGKLSCNALFRIKSEKADSYKNVFSPALINSVVLIEADTAFGGLEFKKINGNLAMKGPDVSAGKVHFSHDKKDYILSFARTPGSDPGYDVSLRSHDIDLESSLVNNDNNLLIKKLSGDLFSVRLDLSGEIVKFPSPDRHVYIRGRLETRLKDLAAYPGEYSDFIKAHGLDGNIKSDINLRLKGPDPHQCKFDADITAKDLLFENIHVDTISTTIRMSDGQLIFPSFNAFLYKGSFWGSLGIELYKKNAPYMLFLESELRELELGSLLSDLNGNKYNVFGICNIDISIERNAEDAAGAESPAAPLPGFFKELGKYTGSAVFELKKTGVKNIKLDDLSGELTLKNGKLNIPATSGSLYNGTLEANLVMDIEDDLLPYNFSSSVKTVDFSRLINDINQKGNNIYGTLDSKFFLKGRASDLTTTTGNGEITIKNANLGPMPLLAPLIGDLYSTLQDIFTPAQRININSASASFKIKDEKITADDITLWGDDIYITAHGYVGFDGKLDLYFQNQFRDPESEDNETWQNILRTSIVKFGRSISRARLTGTIKDPEWDFEYLVKNIITDNIRRFFKGISR